MKDTASAAFRFRPVSRLRRACRVRRGTTARTARRVMSVCLMMSDMSIQWVTHHRGSSYDIKPEKPFFRFYSSLMSHHQCVCVMTMVKIAEE